MRDADILDMVYSGKSNFWSLHTARPLDDLFEAGFWDQFLSLGIRAGDRVEVQTSAGTGKSEYGTFAVDAIHDATHKVRVMASPLIVYRRNEKGK